MKIASLSELKKELLTRSPEEVLALCLRLARQKKESKELLHYLVFEAEDEESYVQALKDDMDDDFEAINTSHVYWAKKSISKVLRGLNKHLRFSGNKRTEVEMRLYFCQKIKDLQVPIRKSVALYNLYQRQLAAINKALGYLHEDLRADYEYALEELREI